MLSYKYPLNWPSYIPATALRQQRSDNGFSTNMTLSDVLLFLDEELSSAGIKQAVLYSDYEQINIERLRKKIGNRTGTCLHIKYRERNYIIACDRWQKLDHNIYALHLAFRQWANMEKWGIANMSILLTGFAIDSNDSITFAKEIEGNDDCLQFFGLGATATLDDATAIYHRRAKTIASNEDELVKLNQAMDEVRKYFANKNSLYTKSS